MSEARERGVTVPSRCSFNSLCQNSLPCSRGPSQFALHGSVQAKSKATENNAENSFPAFGLLPPEEAETTSISTRPIVDRSVRGDLRIVAALNECRGKSRDLSVGSVLQIRHVVGLLRVQVLPDVTNSPGSLDRESVPVILQGVLRHSRTATTTDVYMQEIPASVQATVNSINRELRKSGPVRDSERVTKRPPQKLGSGQPIRMAPGEI